MTSLSRSDPMRRELRRHSARNNDHTQHDDNTTNNLNNKYHHARVCVSVCVRRYVFLCGFRWLVVCCFLLLKATRPTSTQRNDTPHTLQQHTQARTAHIIAIKLDKQVRMVGGLVWMDGACSESGWWRGVGGVGSEIRSDSDSTHNTTTTHKHTNKHTHTHNDQAYRIRSYHSSHRFGIDDSLWLCVSSDPILTVCRH